MPERYREGKNESIWGSRFFKGGTVATVVGLGFGVGLAVQLGLLAAGGGAGAHHITKGRKS